MKKLWIALFLLCLCSAALAEDGGGWQDGDIGFIARQETALYSSIGEDRKILGQLPEDTAFTVLTAEEPWLQIITAEQQGWIHASNARHQTYYDGLEWAVVYNPKEGDRLNLRKKPSVRADSLGKYYTGTRVVLLEEEQQTEWAHVRIGNIEGYMQRVYLVYAASAPTVISYQPRVTIQNPDGSGLNLRISQNTRCKVLELIPNGEEVTVLGLTEKWLHVLTADGQTGFIKADAVTPRLTYNQATVSLRKGRIIRDCTVYLRPVVNPADADELSRGVYSPGDIVTVYSVSGGWARVSYGDEQYYVHAEDVMTD